MPCAGAPRFAAGLIGWALAASAAGAQVPPPPSSPEPSIQTRPADLFVYYLGWRWTPGDEHRYRVDIRESLEVTGPAGERESAESRSIWLVSDRVIEINDDGFAIVERTFTGADLEMRHPRLTGDATARFDSADADAEPPELLRGSAALVGKAVRFEVDAMGRVYDASYTDKPPAGAPATEHWVQLLDAMFAVAPGQDVVVGDTWTASMEAAMPSGPLRLDRRSKIQSIRRGGGERVGVIAMLTEPASAIDPDAPLSPGEPRLRAHAEHGRAMFDLVNGRLDEAELRGLSRFDVADAESRVSTHWLRREIDVRRLDPAPSEPGAKE